MNIVLKIGGILAAILGVGALVLIGQAMRHPAQARFVPDPQNDKVLYVVGWNAEELEKMISRFRFKYKESLHASLSISPTQVQSNSFRLTFPNDIEPEYFRFLVNYIRYPEDISESGRSILVAGQATLDTQFSLPSPALIGQKAIIYVPTSDQDFDLVYVRTERGEVYKDSFVAFSSWELVNDPRLPSGIESIPWGTP